MSLIWSYIGQEVSKCSSVSTSFCGQWAHSLSSLENQVCLRRPFSIARLCSLSLYNISLSLGQSVVRYSATVYSLFRARWHSSLLSFFVIIFLFSYDLVGSNCVAVPGLCGIPLSLCSWLGLTYSVSPTRFKTDCVSPLNNLGVANANVPGLTQHQSLIDSWVYPHYGWIQRITLTSDLRILLSLENLSSVFSL